MGNRAGIKKAIILESNYEYKGVKSFFGHDVDPLDLDDESVLEAAINEWAKLYKCSPKSKPEVIKLHHGIRGSPIAHVFVSFQFDSSNSEDYELARPPWVGGGAWTLTTILISPD